MLRRMKRVFLGLMLLCAWAAAEEEARLPQAVLELSESVHPGYEVIAHDGWGSESSGQFALILKQGDDNILCIAEKAQSDAAYQLTIDNTNAVYDGDQLPSLLIDTGGDALFYGYDDGNDAVHVHTEKLDGKWQTVDVTVYENLNGGYRSIQSGVGEGYLYYDEDTEDENGNILQRFSYAPIPVDASFEQAMLPENFDIGQYDADPIYGLYQICKTPGFAGNWVQSGERLVAADLKREHVVLLIEAESGMFLRIARMQDGLYQLSQMGPLPSDVGMDAFHSGEGKLILTRHGGMTLYGFELREGGCWQMTYVQGRSGIVLLHDGVYSMDRSVLLRNDGVIYGVHPWNDLLNIDLSAVPETLEEAVIQIDQSAYALVNNPNPEDRLHLRAKPDKGSHSYGKFYNRTPVLVLERGDTWTKVQIGCGGAAMTGYMMTKFLVFDEKKKAELACAFPQKLLLEGHPNGVHMYADPRETAVTDRIFKQSSGDFIIGVSGNEWFIVLRADGAVGYVPQHAFWDGNG